MKTNYSTNGSVTRAMKSLAIETPASTVVRSTCISFAVEETEEVITSLGEDVRLMIINKMLVVLQDMRAYPGNSHSLYVSMPRIFITPEDKLAICNAVEDADGNIDFALVSHTITIGKGERKVCVKFWHSEVPPDSETSADENQGDDTDDEDSNDSSSDDSSSDYSGAANVSNDEDGNNGNDRPSSPYEDYFDGGFTQELLPF